MSELIELQNNEIRAFCTSTLSIRPGTLLAINESTVEPLLHGTVT